jgi:hypothetical protein
VEGGKEEEKEEKEEKDVRCNSLERLERRRSEKREEAMSDERRRVQGCGLYSNSNTL